MRTCICAVSMAMPHACVVVTAPVILAALQPASKNCRCGAERRKNYYLSLARRGGGARSPSEVKLGIMRVCKYAQGKITQLFNLN